MASSFKLFRLVSGRKIIKSTLYPIGCFTAIVLGNGVPPYIFYARNPGFEGPILSPYW